MSQHLKLDKSNSAAPRRDRLTSLAIEAIHAFFDAGYGRQEIAEELGLLIDAVGGSKNAAESEKRLRQRMEETRRIEFLPQPAFDAKSIRRNYRAKRKLEKQNGHSKTKFETKAEAEAAVYQAK